MDNKMNFDWNAFWNARAKQDDISASGRGERTSVVDVIKSFAESARRLKLTAGDRVLDVGCSTGAFCLGISPFVEQAIGMDFSPEMAGRAALNVESSGARNLSIVVADVRRLPYKDNHFEKINCWSVLQYLRSKSEGFAAIKELYRVLKPGGRLLLGGIPNVRIKRDYIDGVWRLNKSAEEKQQIVERNEVAIWYEAEDMASFVRQTLSGQVTILEDQPGAWYQGQHFDLVVVKPQ